MRGYIYTLTNTVENKMYVGQTMNLADRLTTHKCIHKDTPISKAIQQFGWHVFIAQVIEVIEMESKDELRNKMIEKEIYYIRLYDSYNNGYNATTGGIGATGLRLSSEQKAKLGEARKGEKNSFFGKRHNQDTKSIISEKLKEMYKKMDSPFLGKKHSEETRRRLSESAKKREKRTVSEETKKKLSLALRGKPRPQLLGRKYSEETKQKMSKALKGRVFSEEHKKKISESKKGKKQRYSQQEANRKKVKINDVVYNSISEAAKAHNISIATMSKRFQSKKPNYEYVQK